MSEREKGSVPQPPTLFETKVVQNSIKEKGYFVLPEGTCAKLQVAIANQEGTGYESKNLGLVKLKSSLEVVGQFMFDEPLEGAPKNTRTLTFVPTSEQLRANQREFARLADAKLTDASNDARPGVDPVKERYRLMDQEQKVNNITNELARQFLDGKEKLLEDHGLQKSEVKFVYLSVAAPAREKPSPWIAVPIDVYLGKLARELNQEKSE